MYRDKGRQHMSVLKELAVCVLLDGEVSKSAH